MTREKKTQTLVWALWVRRDSNPRPSGCKPDALNQLSYAPQKCECKYKLILNYEKLSLNIFSNVLIGDVLQTIKTK